MGLLPYSPYSFLFRKETGVNLYVLEMLFISPVQLYILYQALIYYRRYVLASLLQIIQIFYLPLLKNI